MKVPHSPTSVQAVTLFCALTLMSSCPTAESSIQPEKSKEPTSSNWKTELPAWLHPWFRRGQYSPRQKHQFIENSSIPGAGNHGPMWINVSDDKNRQQNSSYDIPKLAVTTSAVALSAVALAVGISVPLSVNTNKINSETQFPGLDQVIANIGSFSVDATPQNDLPFPVTGSSFQDDQCGDAGVRYADGACYPLLKRGPCPDPLHWMTVDPVSRQGKCRPRLCGKGRVFVGRDGLCHDVSAPSECHGGRRLYYSAYGDPLCDCPIGQFPFPTVRDHCVPLFTRGPCPAGHVVAVIESGQLGCTPKPCQANEEDVGAAFQLVPHGDGHCYAIGSRGPCRNNIRPIAAFYGFDVFKRKSLCENVNSSRSPYFVSIEEERFLDRTFSQLYPDYGDYQVTLSEWISRRHSTAESRQDTNTAGLFRVPSSAPVPLLNPCRSGARNGNNFKCTTPLVPSTRAVGLLQAVRSSFACQPGAVLQATGQCGASTASASCGPSYRFVAATRQCRQII